MGAKFASLRFAIWTASLACSCGAADCVVVSRSFAADLPAMKAPQPFDYDWTGFYVGGHVGLAAGREGSATVAGGASIGGAFGLYRSPNAFTEGGSFFDSVQFGDFSDAVALAQATGSPADVNAVRSYTSRPGVSLNIEQQLNDTLGAFFRAGWADGHKEPWDFTDIDRTAQGGVSINGKSWGRPNDTIGIAGVVNGINNAHIAFFNAGGLGILIGDGLLTNYRLASTRLAFDYQFVANPAYNADRGPVNIFAGRAHWQF